MLKYKNIVIRNVGSIYLGNITVRLFAKIRKICLPKDYIAYKMTGVFSTDYSDASGMLQYR